MARELGLRGLDVVVCSPGTELPELREAGISHVAMGRVRAVPANGSRAPLTFSLRAMRAFASIATTLREGVVHVHEPFAPLAAYGVLAAHRRPTVGTFHRGGGGPAYVAGRPIIARLGHGLDVVTAVSDHAAATIAQVLGRRPVVLFNGLELDRFAQAAPTATRSPTILFVGRHEERKGLAVLLEALSHLELPIECWIVGSGPQTAALTARYATDGRLRWLGRLGDDEVRSRMRGADVLCVPSLGGESFGLVPLEGMAARTAVVCSDIEGYASSTGGHATLVAPGDPVALSKALRDAISRPASARALEAAFEHAAAWSMAALVDRYLPLYEEARSRFAAATATR
jgi:phosphatidylinositol alpha-mannosyltransferase